MYKKFIRVLAASLIFAVFISLCPVTGVVLAQSAQPEPIQTGHSLNYAELRKTAYIINPQWTGDLSGQTVSYEFRGNTYNESYDPARHFSGFAAAYSYFESLYTNANGSLKSGISSAVPVFILAPGNYGGARMEVRYNAIILGANAGISPNADIDLKTADPRAGWAANSGRGSETVITSGFTRSTIVNGSSTNAKYEQAAVSDGTDKFTLIIDGVEFNTSQQLVKLGDTSASVSRVMDVTIQNTNAMMTKASAASDLYIYDNDSAKNINNYTFKNLRSVGTKTIGFYGANASNVILDGVYFAQTNARLAPYHSVLKKADFSFLMQNSYMYKCSGGYTLVFKYTTGDEHKSHVEFSNNIFYEHNSGVYGSMLLYSTKSSRNSEYVIDIHDNTFIADHSYNSGAKNTFLNGNTGYQQGAFTMYVNRNRVIGYTSLFPNMPNNVTHITADFNYNYFAPTFSGFSDVLGTTSEYFGTKPYSDPIDIDNLIYYEDYAMTVYDGMLDVSGVSFYDDADYVSIDNDSNLITASYTCGKAIFNPKLYFRDSGTVAAFYSDADCTARIRSIAAPAMNSTVTVYAKITKGSASKKMTVILYGENGAPSFAGAWNDSEGIIGADACLLAPAVSALSDGASYKASFCGETYVFTVGQNAFSSLNEIFEAAGSTAPQIILPYGSYGTLNITKPCEIYGENYRSPAAAGIGAYDWSAGPAWTGGKSSSVSGMTLSCAGVTVSGVELTGAVTDASRTSNGTVVFKNSVINAPRTTVAGYRQFNITNSSVRGEVNEYVLSGVHVKSLSRDENGNSVLFGGLLPSSLTGSGCFVESAATRIFDSAWNINLYRKLCTATVTDSRFDISDINGGFLTDIKRGVCNDGFDLSYTVAGNVFKVDPTATGAVMKLSPELYSDLHIENNIFISEDAENAEVLSFDFKNSVSEFESFTFLNNRIIGFETPFGKVNDVPAQLPADVSENYFADYAEDFMTQSGGKCPAGFVKCSSYYEDYAMLSLKPAVDVSFTGKNGLVCNSESLTLEMNVGKNVSSVDFTDGYIENIGSYVLSGAYMPDLNAADISAIAVSDVVTTLILKISVPENPCVFAQYTLKLYRETDPRLGIEYISSDKGVVIPDPVTGGYTLTLPETSSGASLDIKAYGDASALLMLDGSAVTNISGVESGSKKIYKIRVSIGQSFEDYKLTVVRPVSGGLALDYDSYADSAYIINSGWSNVSGGNVSFVYRGNTYTQSYDQNRHFASFDAAYSHWLSTNPDILHDTPVFILTAGTYGNIRVYYRAIILGTNAGINPNDPTADVSELKPGGSISENTAWDSANETVISGTIYRSTRVSGNNVLTLEKTVQDAENAADSKMRFFFTADGIKFTGGGFKLSVDDVDIGNRTDSANSISLNVTGRRADDMYLQNIKSENMTGHICSAQDTTFNYNSLTVKNLRVKNFRGASLFRKYIDKLVVDGAYVTGSSMSISLFAVDGDMNMRHDMDYTIKNSAFVNNNLTRTVRLRTTPLASGDYERGRLVICNNAFLETGNAQWGIISLSSTLPNVTSEIHDNLFCQTGAYNNVSIRTAIEGNTEFYVNPMTMRVNQNRFVGIETYLPNLAQVTDENLGKLDFDFSNNYFSPSYSGENDVTGTLPAYISGPDGDVDPINLQSLTYYRDYKMQVLNTDFDLENVSFNGNETLHSIDNNSRTASIVLTENANAALSFATKGNGVEKQLIDEDGAVVSQVKYIDVAAGKNSYTLRLTKNGVQCDYALNITAGVVGYFSQVYSDPVAQIENTAYLLTPEVQNKSAGEVFIANWKGVYYKFVVGQNAFSSISQINSIRQSGPIQIIIPNTEIEGELRIPANTSVFGVNYDVNPNAAQSGDISSDWSLNPLWGRYGQSEVGSIAIEGNASGTDIVIKGITLRGRFFDVQRPASSQRTTVTLENILVEHESLLPESAYGYYSTVYAFTFSNSNNVSGSSNQDIGVMRNIRVAKVMCSEDIAGGKNRLLNEYLPSDFTIDGLYCDMSVSDVSRFGWWKMSSNQQNGQLTVKNCNFRNSAVGAPGNLLYFEGRNHVNNGSEQTAVLNITNNCFYNTQTSAEGFNISPYAYSGINITGNLFLSSSAKTQEFIKFQDTQTPGGALSMNIFGNRFVGVSGNINNPAENSLLDLSGNYSSVYTPGFINAVTGTAMTGSNTKCGWHYLDYALTRRSDGLSGYEFVNGIKADLSKMTLSLTIGAGRDEISLSDYIITENTLSVKGVSDITKVPVSDGKVYDVTVSKSGKSETWTLTLHVNPVDMSELYSALDRAAQYTDSEAYRDFAYARLKEAAHNGMLVARSDTSDKQSADKAVLRINLAIELMEKTSELDSLIESARTIDFSSAESLKILNFRASLNEALDLAVREQNTVAEIDRAYLALYNAALDIVVGIDEFSALIQQAKEIQDSEVFSYYTRTTSNELKYRYANAEKVINDTKTPFEDAVAAAGALSKAITGLEPNRSKLISAVNAVSVISNTGNTYTESSYKKLRDTIDYANSLENPTAYEIMEACKAIYSARDSLVNRSGFNSTLERVEKINNDDNTYCKPTFDALTKAIEAAKTAAAGFESAQDVEDAVKILEDAELGLKTHTLEDYVSNGDASCTADGTETASCTTNGCTYSVTRADEGSKLGHLWDEGTVVKAADCQNTGTVKHKCMRSGCGAEKVETIPINPDAHVWKEGIVISEPTCTLPGKMVTSCTVPGCGAVSQTVDIQPIGHDWDDGVVTKTPTCYEEGVRTFTCKNDPEHKKTEAIEKTAHSWGEGKITKAPTCSAQGEKTYTCSVCHKTRTEAVPISADSHDWDEGKITKAPTCSAQGVKTYTCKNDPSHTRTETVAVDPQAHDWDDGAQTKAPTCEDKGVCTFTCKHDASHTYTEEIEALGHSWDEGKITKAPTCSVPGEKTYTCKNDPTHTRIEAVPISADSHDWNEGEITKASTCSAPGEKTYTCKNDPTHTRTEAVPIDPLAHSWGEYVYNNDATYEADGTKTRVCGLCGKADTVTAEGTKLTETITPVDSSEKFIDVEGGRWYKPYIDYVATYGLMNGVSDNEFAPSLTLTRAMFVQILANMSGIDTDDRNVQTAFDDVPSGKWYSAAVKWAADNKIVNGTSPASFSPNDPVQRQQICTMIVRYAEFAGITLDGTLEKAEFEDDGRIQNYAKEAVYICQRAGIVNGMDEKTFAPRDNATRAQVAAIIQRFHDNFLNK